MFKRLLSDSINLVFQNLDMVFRVCGTWIAIQLLLSFIIILTVGTIDQTTDPETLPPGAALLLLLNVIVAVLASASIAVAWHRFAILGERTPALYMRFGALEGRFLWKMVLLLLIAVAAMLPVMLLAMVLSAVLPPVIAIILVVCAMLFLVLPHLIRLNLVLPATALERPIGFLEAHRLAEGLGWRMLWAVIVLSLPFSLAGLAIEYVLSLTGLGLPLVLVQVKVMILNVLLQILVTVLGLSVITAGYRLATDRELAEPFEE